MKRKERKEVSRFPFNLSQTILLLCIAALALCALGVAVSVFRIVRHGVNGFYDIIKYPFMIALCLLAILLIVALLCKSEYVISEKYLHSDFGLIKSKVELKTITSAVVDLQEEKITVYTGEEFFVLLLKKKVAQSFAAELLKANPKIDLSYTLTETKPPEPKEEDKKE